jgi:hypothetical protein
VHDPLRGMYRPAPVIMNIQMVVDHRILMNAMNSAATKQATILQEHARKTARPARITNRSFL